MVTKMFFGNGLCNTITYVFKGHVKIIKIYIAKFNVSILNRLKIIFFLQIQSGYIIHLYVLIFNKTAIKLVTILTKCFFPYLNPASDLKAELT